MGIGAGIFLIAIGAILKFALNINVQGVDLPTVGVILMIVGVIGIVIEAAIFMPRRRRRADAADEYRRPVRRDRDEY